MSVGYTTFFPKKDGFTKFVVRNIAPNNKRIRIFQYPINNGDIRDLMAIPGVSEADIRASLLKGELVKKFDAREIELVESDIDLIQFNQLQKTFLKDLGFSVGLDAGSVRKEDVSLNGVKNSINTIFTISDKFLYNSDFKIAVYRNGVRQMYTYNYLIAESGGASTGYDTIIFVDPPDEDDELIIDYFPA